MDAARYAPFVAANHIVHRTPKERFDALADVSCTLKPSYDLLQDVGPIGITAHGSLETLLQGDKPVFLNAFVGKVDQVGLIHGWTIATEYPCV